MGNPKATYTQTARVGIIRACLRFIEDPNRPLYQRLALAFAPALVLYILSPIDLVPEFILGPLGLADDTALMISLVLLIHLASSLYRQKRYVKPTEEPQTQRKHVESEVRERKP